MMLIDTLRVLAVVTAAIVGLMSLYLTLAVGPALNLATRFRFAGVVLTAVFVCVQEGEQIGKPFVWWRLPLLIAINLCFGIGIALGARNDWHPR